MSAKFHSIEVVELFIRIKLKRAVIEEIKRDVKLKYENYLLDGRCVGNVKIKEWE